MINRKLVSRATPRLVPLVFKFADECLLPFYTTVSLRASGGEENTNRGNINTSLTIIIIP